MASSGDLTVRVRSALDAHRRRDRVGAWWKLSAGCAALVCVAALAPLHAVMVAPAGDRFVDSLADAPAAIQAQPRTVAPFQAANPDARRTPARGPSEERFGIATVRRGIGPQPNGSYLASDMATVRRSLGMVTFNDNEFIVHGASIRLLIENAFGIGTSGNEDRRYTSIEGIPSWPERFDVEARPARPITRGREFPPAEVRSMLQNLLADRFELVAHWEPRDKVVYDLLRDGLPGPRLQRCAELPDLCQNGRRGFSNGTSRLPGQSDFTRSYGMYGYPLTLFIRNLEIDLRCPIIDRTGLEGPYSLELEHLVHYSGGRIIQTSSGPMSIPGLVLEMSAVPPNENWLALSAALREQLGLRLEPRAASEEVLVIDRVSLPAYDSPRSP